VEQAETGTNTGPGEAVPAHGNSAPTGSAGVPATSVATSSTPPGSAKAPVPPWAWGTLLLLFAMNLLTSIDLWLLARVLPEVRPELKLSETQAGWLPTVLLLAFAVWSPALGYLADRWRRPRLLAIGFALWSLAAVGTGLARSYEQLQIARALVGAGGATFLTVALTLVMDLFPLRVRGRALATLFMAMPLGAGLAMGPGWVLAKAVSWQTAFLLVGAPGLALALLALAVPEPVRGLSEQLDVGRLQLHERVGPSQEDYIDLMVNSSSTYSVFGITFSSFALAGLVYWSPAFLTLAKGITEARADLPLGMAFLAAAALGTAAGGVLADCCSTTKPRLLFLLPGFGNLSAIVFVLVAIYAQSLSWICGGIFVAECMIFLNIAPCYTILSTVVMPNMRAVACGVVLAAIHLLGDIWSPSLIGWVIDTCAQRDFMATPFGRALAALGAVPVSQPGRDPENLTAGMLALLPPLLIAGAVLIAGVRHLPREMALMHAKLRAAPSRRRPAGAGSQRP
jgi:MFS transporter, Spinster family, sphingosine-1-phosphate transporter